MWLSMEKMLCISVQINFKYQECWLDFVVLYDQSESINRSDFETLKRFVIELIQYLDAKGGIGAEENHVFVFAYDDKIDEIYNPLNGFDQNADSAIQAIKNHIQGRGTTRTDLGIMAANEVDLRSDRSRQPRIQVVITDGESSDGSNVPLAVQESDRLGFIRIAVGIGGSINEAELVQIAGENVFLLDNFDELLSIVDDIGDAVCQPIIEETPILTTEVLNKPQIKTTAPPQPVPVVQQQVTENQIVPPNQIEIQQEEMSSTLAPTSDFGFSSFIQSSITRSSPCRDTCRPCPRKKRKHRRRNSSICNTPLPKHVQLRNAEYEKYMRKKEQPPKNTKQDQKLVFRQTFGYQFKPYELTLNPHDPCCDNFSILGEIEKFRAPNDMFTFRLYYPEFGIENIQMQNNNPAIEKTGVCCYEPICIEKTEFGQRGMAFNGKTALFNGSSSKKPPFYAIGAFCAHNNGLPGQNNSAEPNVVELYALPPHQVVVVCDPPPQIAGTRKDQCGKACQGTVVKYECTGGVFGCSGQCYQDAVCLPKGQMQGCPDNYVCDEDFIGPIKGEQVGLPLDGDCRRIRDENSNRYCGDDKNEYPRRKYTSKYDTSCYDPKKEIMLKFPRCLDPKDYRKYQKLVISMAWKTLVK